MPIYPNTTPLLTSILRFIEPPLQPLWRPLRCDGLSSVAAFLRSASSVAAFLRNASHPVSNPIRSVRFIEPPLQPLWRPLRCGSASRKRLFCSGVSAKRIPSCLKSHPQCAVHRTASTAAVAASPLWQRFCEAPPLRTIPPVKKRQPIKPPDTASALERTG
jgi:hypothetical protein